jgi:hypothetical protein
MPKAAPGSSCAGGYPHESGPSASPDQHPANPSPTPAVSPKEFACLRPLSLLECVPFLYDSTNRTGVRAGQLNYKLQSIPHARAENKNLRFDFAASQAVSPADEPSGTPLRFWMLSERKPARKFFATGSIALLHLVSGRFRNWSGGRSGRRSGWAAFCHLALVKKITWLQRLRRLELIHRLYAVSVHLQHNTVDGVVGRFKGI